MKPKITYQFNITTTEVEVGDILIANVFFKEEIFHRKVILLLEHNENGSFGLILNKQTDISLENILTIEAGNITVPLYHGGPVETNTLHFIHEALEEQDFSVDSKPIASGLYWGRDFEILPRLLDKNPVDKFRFFLGYSGWSSGQLNFELENNSWFVTKMKDSFIFNTASEKMWEMSLTSLGEHYKLLLHYPGNIALN